MKVAILILLGISTPMANGGWIDIDTPEELRQTRSFVDGTVYDLIMSDEFNVPNRTFKDGHDPIWTALDKSDDDSSAAGGGSLHFYNSSTVTSEDGRLKIKSSIKKTEWEHYDPINKNFRHVTKYFDSGMVQSWNKFCFTGGIVEVDLIFPGDPTIGGLWPAAWMLGNLGRATYEASTNMIWPWSYNTCDRDLQEPQLISACNKQNHFGLNEYQGRGATEIDIVEMMSGAPGTLPSTDPPISLPYVDMTLQIAPGVPKNRPNSGSQPFKKVVKERNGHPTGAIAEVWYDGLEYYGNTSLNPFFYGTYLGETKPEEPVSRLPDQAFQADAVGAMHQLTDAHFQTMHSFRLEWQPGPGGRLDWYTKAHKKEDTMDKSVEGDGFGEEWVKAYSIKGESIEDLMGSQIPNEPTYLIFNTAISSTWGFPYSFPPWCEKCYDCNDPKCACSFHAGFCEMMQGNVTFEIDSVRVYQSKNHSAHVGNPHTVGCDPAEYPTREYIKGNEYKYSRMPPFNDLDLGSLKKIQTGGGQCDSDFDCGSEDSAPTNVTESKSSRGRGSCINEKDYKLRHYNVIKKGETVCQCNEGFVGPHCKSLNQTDDEKGIYQIKLEQDKFHTAPKPYIPPFITGILFCLVAMLIGVAIKQGIEKNTKRSKPVGTPSN